MNLSALNVINVLIILNLQFFINLTYLISHFTLDLNFNQINLHYIIILN